MTATSATVVAASRRTPIVVVLGTTGAGKSKLAIEIAQRFGGEVISADAVQMYKGLDIVTNKVTTEERSLVKHHCIDFLHPLTRFNIVDFRNMALPIIESLLGEGKIPVICGGTNYYIESLLWKILIDDSNNSCEENELRKREGHEEAEDEDTIGLSNIQLYSKLKQIDPQRAEEIHPNERRKTLRSLQVYKQQKRPHSEILSEQRKRSQNGNPDKSNNAFLGGPLRYPADDVAVIWVQCSQDVLDQRCDARVDKMMEAGMLQEMIDFQKEVAQAAIEKDNPKYTNGIFQTIGFKEFHEYLHSDNKTKEENIALLEKGVDKMKVRTRQYARRQLKWINQRFLNGGGRPGDLPRVYKVDSSNYPQGWDEDCHNPAAKIVQSYIDGEAEVSGMEPIPINLKAHSYDDTRKMYTCELCNIQVKGKLQLEQHLSSKGHKHQQKMEKIRKESKENSSINLYVTPVVKSDIRADDKHKTVMTLKKLTGLPLETANKFIKNLQLEWKSDSEKIDISYCVEGISHSNRFRLQKMQADINCGNYDTSWVKFTTLQPQNLHVIPMDKSEISANDKQIINK